MINKIFKNRGFLVVLQFFTLIVFVLLLYDSIGVTTNNPDFTKILRNTNISNLIVWSYWWPLIIVTAILLERYWCSICPMELVTSFLGKIGFRIKSGKFLKSGWIITLFYAIILILGIHTLLFHRIPYWKFVFSEPKGVNTAIDIIQNPELLQNDFLTNLISPTISIIAVFLLILGLILSFYVIKKQIHVNRISRIISALAVIIYSNIFIITMVEWKVL